MSSSSPAMPPPPASPREHVERIRRERYYIGRGEQNPLAEDMHQAVNYLSQELYSKDVHFLMELVQNAEDNEYPSEVAPSLEFLITSKDITGCGASSTLLIFNNERGFSSTNIESICRVGKSTKKGNRHQGYIGEKGIGFKSVFLISSQPHIFSNGYQIKFNEKPCAECNIGYIVPEWVESTPNLSDIEKLYGCSKVLPTTTIILPLKSEKIDVTKTQLSSMHPEMLLFLTKIRKLSVREDNSETNNTTVSEISISSEKNYQARKNMHAESYTIHLSAEETGKDEAECGYFMWRQKFPVKPENKVDKRAEIDEWVITLAFPHGERLSRGKQISPGIYAFLPTEMVTSFPFIIQADFLLASSREAILFDSPWNKGILECVPSAFMDAFVTLVKSGADASPSMSLPSMFNFLPANTSQISLLEPVRSGIKDKVLAEDIVPCQSYTSQKIFCKPTEVARLQPAFWTILDKAWEHRVDLKNLSTHGTYILSSPFDNSIYDSVLNFLEVKNVNHEWYAKCIEGSNLVKEVPEQLYLEIIYFVADNWQNFIGTKNMLSIPLLKYVDRGGALSFWSISRATQWNDRLCIASENKYISWLISWNKEFLSSNRFFLPPSTQTALEDFSEKRTLKNWLQHHAKVEVISVYSYGSAVVDSLGSDQRAIIAFAHFLYHSSKMRHIESYLSDLCRTMPVIDSYGYVVKERNSIIVPAKGSKWVGLMGTNPWRNEGYIELSADYKSAGHFAGNYTSEGQLLEFLKINLEASDVPFIKPPNARFPTVSSPLTVNNAFLLLEWIRNLKSSGVRLPDLFLACVKKGSWLKMSAGYKSPDISFLSSSNWGSILQSGPCFVDIPVIDQQFYQNKLHMYKEELKEIGVRFEFQEASAYIGDHLMAAGNSLTREDVYVLLRLMRYLQEKFLSPSELIKSVKEERWMKSTLGYRRPSDCIIKDSAWAVASCISDQPFLDVKFYGEGILSYKPELELLGVIIGFKDNYQLVIDNFKFSSATITSEATLLILKCIHYVVSCEDFIRKLKDLKWLKTNVGFHAPNMSFLVDPEWECLLKVFNGIPVIDYGFYGSVISSYKEELKMTGLITRFDEASKAITNIFKQKVLNSSLEKTDVLALLESYRQLSTHSPLPVELFNSLCTEKWLYTSLGFRSPSDAILFDDAWKPLSPVANLPFIDDGDSCHGLGKKIYGYKDELKKLGVTVEAKQGARFVITGINIPSDPSKLSKATVLSLLGCIKSYFTHVAGPPKGFQENMCKKWLKTSMGYQCPNDSILFDPKQSSVCMEDGPFIDEAFYGSEIASFKDVLARIGVTTNYDGTKQGQLQERGQKMQREQKAIVSTSSDFLEDEKHIHSSAAVKKRKQNMQSKSSHTGKKPKAKSYRDVRDNLPEGSYGSKDQDTLENESVDPRPKEKPWKYGSERDSDAPGISRREISSSVKHDKHLASEEQKMHISPPATVSIANAAPTHAAPVVIAEHWVRCDICDKWRLLPYELNPSNLPKEWNCSMLYWLPGMNRCEIREEETENALNALYVRAPAYGIPAVLVGHPHVASSDSGLVLNRVGHVDDKQIPQSMPLDFLREITNDFSKERRLGSGTFGTVYKGVLDGKEVAVKLLHCSVPQKLNYEEEFMKEFENLRRLNHPNIVRLLGFCYETKKVCVKYEGNYVIADKIDRALCFDYMHNGSLQQHLDDESCGLDWNTRYKIIKGTCEGLKYLHKGLENPMFHLDLKPGNVLLDKNMVPKLADFGLSKLVCDNQTQATSSFLGTIGYCPPEHIDRHLFSVKFDIFSLGVVMIEIIAGSKGRCKAVEMGSRGFIDHVQENWRKRIHRAIPACTLPNYGCRQVKRCIEIALECVHPERMQRPDIEDIISRLNKTENKF